MDSETLYLTLLIASIFAAANCTFTHGLSGSIEGKVTKTVWKDDKGSGNRGDYKLKASYPSFDVKEHRNGDGYAHGNFKDGGTAISKYDNVDGKLNRGKLRDGHRAVGYNYRKNDQGQEDKDGGSKSDGYNHNYKHGYHHSHGYSRHHKHSDGKDKNGDGDGYHGYHRFRIEHDHDREGKNSDSGCGRAGCKYGGYHFDDGYEFHYGNDGKGDGHNYNEDDHGGYNNDFARNEQSLGNEGVDDHGTDYHYAMSGNYGKDYSDFANGHHYRHHEQDHDSGSHDYGHVRHDH